MDAAKKLQADREYVDRFFHGVASKLMTHPYFSKFASASTDVHAPTVNLSRILEDYKEAKKIREEEQKKVSSSPNTSSPLYLANMVKLRELIKNHTTLNQHLKQCKVKEARDNYRVEITKVENQIKSVYVSNVPNDISTAIKEVTCPSPPPEQGGITNFFGIPSYNDQNMTKQYKIVHPEK